MGDGEPAPPGLERMRNLGPDSAARLQAVGIDSPERLRLVGSMEAYARLRRAYPDETTEVSLYALHGALVDSAWQDLPEATRMALRDAAGHLVGPGGSTREIPENWQAWPGSSSSGAGSSAARSPSA